MKPPLTFCVAWLLATSGVAQPAAPATLPAPLRDVRLEQRLGEQVPLALTFQDETGQTVRLRELLHGRPAVLVLVYYQCPMLCPLVLGGLTRSLRGLSLDAGKDYDVISVSFDPRDTPAQSAAQKATYLKDYRRDGATDGWHFLTGSETNIAQLAAAVGFHYHYDPETKQYAHAAAVYVLTPAGKLARCFAGIEYAGRDLRLALVEASAGKIGTLVDQVWLYCFHYDPIRGRYGLVILRVVRLAGAATAGTLVGFIGWMLWREKRQAAT